MSNNIHPERTKSSGDDFGYFSDEEIPLKGAIKLPLMDQEIVDHDAASKNLVQTAVGADAENPAEQLQRSEAKPEVADAVDLDEEAAKNRTSGITAAHLKIVASALILIATAVALWPAPPAPSPVAEGVPGLPVDAAPPAGAPPALEIATSSAGEEEIDRLEQDVEGALKKIAPAEQTCSNTTSLTAFDRFQCSEYGVEKFYRCTEQTGRMWNADLPSCELI